MKYSILFAPRAVKQLKQLQKSTRQRIARIIDSLVEVPRPPGVKKLTGIFSLYRIRADKFRIIYEIKDKELYIFILRIADRKDVYKKGNIK